jgi:hypothetical protein
MPRSNLLRPNPLNRNDLVRGWLKIVRGVNGGIGRAQRFLIALGAALG